MKKINIAIDGYSGCGKSTLAKDLAQELDYTFIDTGALYRGITHLLMTHFQIDSISEVEVEKLLTENPRLQFSSENNHLLCNGIDVESEIRSSSVAAHVSMVAAMPAVRNYLLEVQHSLIENKGVVMEGRDIGTVIMPDAEVKFFITASVNERVERRFLQLQQSGKNQTREEVRVNLESRDYKDSHRKEAPLRLAKDAIVVDNTLLSREEQLKCLKSIVSAKIDSSLLPFVLD